MTRQHLLDWIVMVGPFLILAAIAAHAVHRNRKAAR